MQVFTKRVLLLIVSISLIVSIVASSGAISTAQVEASSGTMLGAYEVRSAINVNNDAELDLIATGSGTAADPYVLEGYDITGSDGNCIFIGNTTSHVVISNCFLHNASWVTSPYKMGVGVSLFNVTNAVLQNNNFSGNNIGSRLEASSDIVLVNNTCSGNKEYGFTLYGSSNNIMANNNFSGNGIASIQIHSSNNSTITNNTCRGNGIYLERSSNCAITNNTCSEGYDGIHLASASNNNIVSNNNCSRNSADGICLDLSSDYNTVAYNICSGNGNTTNWLSSGIELRSSNHNIVANNSCTGNAYHGIFLIAYSEYNNIVNNECSGNTECAIYLSSLSDHNNIAYNNCSGNGNGIYLNYTNRYNVVANNTICDNTNYGISLMYDEIASSDYNSFYGNVLVNNNGASFVQNASHMQAFDGCTNYWNSSTYGNYWGDWTSPDANCDGIVDFPYSIGGGPSMDSHPLTRSSLPFVTITSPENGTTVYKSTVHVTGTANSAYELDVNGVVVKVKSNGSFSVVISLLEGESSVTATSGCHAFQASDSVIITYVDELQNELEATNERVDGVHDLLNSTIDDLASAIDHIDVVNDMFNVTDARLNLTSEQLAAAIAYLMQVSDHGNDTALDLEETKELLLLTRAWLLSVNGQLTACYDAQNATADNVTSLIDQISIIKASLIELRNSLNDTNASLNLTDDELATLAEELDDLIGDLTSMETTLTTVKGSLADARTDVSSLKSDSLPLVLGAAGLVLGIVALVLVGILYMRRKP